MLTGGGSQIEDIVECAKSVFGSQVRVGYPLNITGLTDYVNKPSYATVLGLLQYSHYNDADSSSSGKPNGSIDGVIDIVSNGAKKAYNWIKTRF